MVPERRGAVPVTGVAFLVAITLILATTASVFVFGIGDDGIADEAVPSAAFDTATESTTLTLTHESGDTIDGDRLEVQGGVDTEVPETVAAGSRIETTPIEDEVRLVWQGDDISATLTTVETEPVDLSELSAFVIESFDVDDSDCSGGTVNVDATIRNTGEVTHEQDIELYLVYDDEEDELFETRTLELAPGETEHISETRDCDAFEDNPDAVRLETEDDEAVEDLAGFGVLVALVAIGLALVRLGRSGRSRNT